MNRQERLLTWPRRDDYSLAGFTADQTTSGEQAILTAHSVLSFTCQHFLLRLTAQFTHGAEFLESTQTPTRNREVTRGGTGMGGGQLNDGCAARPTPPLLLLSPFFVASKPRRAPQDCSTARRHRGRMPMRLRAPAES